DRAVVARRGRIAHARSDQEGVARAPEHLRSAGAGARALGNARGNGAGELCRAARTCGGFQAQHLRERSHLDFRGEPRPRPGRLPHVPEVRVGLVAGLAFGVRSRLPARCGSLALTNPIAWERFDMAQPEAGGSVGPTLADIKKEVM